MPQEGKPDHPRSRLLRPLLARDCLSAAQRDYDGPGGFSHNYFEGLMRPGVCTVCGEPPEEHPWEFDSLTGRRHPAD
ncbi:hypothetical protein [Streptomyces sp. MP131-18]|uniref:hypothetical protein n=1 Tax=Streptomyces sp. MP131-18 TaxID=1857892 RepID=UPI00117CFEB9|nr:hypothetical protein [Streptomyces sp. MP131-18]